MDDVVTTAFPSDCRVCGLPVVRATALPVCDDCRSQPSPQTATLCHRCGEALGMEPVFHPSEGLLCHVCRLAPPAFERAVAFGLYEAELRDMIHLLKYERMARLAKTMGPWMAQAILELREYAGRELIVVPVPLFSSKQRERGYNQAELLADAALLELRRSAPEWKLRRVSGLLRRERETQSQFELTPHARRANLSGAFVADTSKLIPGCEVLLIDDIYTSGATARECSRVLRRAGAAKVWVATLARAQKEMVDVEHLAPIHAAQGFG